MPIRAASYSGASHVVFGKASGFASTLDLGALDGKTGFRLDGVEVSTMPDIRSHRLGT